MQTSIAAVINRIIGKHPHGQLFMHVLFNILATAIDDNPYVVLAVADSEYVYMFTCSRPQLPTEYKKKTVLQLGK